MRKNNFIISLNSKIRKYLSLRICDLMYEKAQKERYNTNNTFIIDRVCYFLLNRNRLDNKNDFECNIFEYYYDTTLVIITFTSNIRNEYIFL